MSVEQLPKAFGTLRGLSVRELVLSTVLAVVGFGIAGTVTAL